jgi:hypothetical protein
MIVMLVVDSHELLFLPRQDFVNRHYGPAINHQHHHRSHLQLDEKLGLSLA